MRCLTCNLPELLEASMPPDEDMVDFIEWAFLEGQIDGIVMAVSLAWLQADLPRCH
jgi:hypothetical protein